MLATQEQLLRHIGDYIAAQLDETAVSSLAFRGLIPPLDTNADLKNFGSGLFPFLGIAPLSQSYQDQNLETMYPIVRCRVLYGDRSGASDPDTLMSRMLGITERVEKILISAVRENRFGIPELIEAVELSSLEWAPTFFTEKDGNKQAFATAYFNLSLYLGVI